MLQDKIRQCREQLSYSQAKLGEYLNVTQQAVGKWEKGIAEPDSQTLTKMAKLFNVSVDYLFGIDNDYTYSEKPQPTAPGSEWVPVYGDIAGGTPIEMIEDILDYEEIDEKMATSGNIFALKVKGDSMAPRICDGDVVIIHAQPNVDNGDIAAVAVNGDTATLKKIKKDTKGVYLAPLNNEFDTTFFSNEEIEQLPIRILGKMIELRGKF